MCPAIKSVSDKPADKVMAEVNTGKQLRIQYINLQEQDKVLGIGSRPNRLHVDTGQVMYQA